MFKKKGDEQKPKKAKKLKKKWLKIGIPAAGVLAVVLAVSAVSGKGGGAVPVYAGQAFTGEISTWLDTSGIIQAEHSETFFAPVDAKVEGIQVSKGDVVKAGDVLLCFDEEAVAYAKRQSELERDINFADYKSSIQNNNEQSAKLAKAKAKIAECEAAIDNYEQYIDALTNGITDMNALKKADLYAKIYSVEKEMNAYELAMQTPEEDTDMGALLGKKTEKQNELNQLNNELSMLSDYKTEYGWEDLLTQAKKDLADYQEQLAEAKSDKASAEAAIVNGNKLAEMELNKEKTQLASEDTGKKYEAALNGIMAGFNGVVSELSVVEGASVQEGTQLMVLESFDELCVEFQASKYDLEVLAVGQEAEIQVSGHTYKGTVAKINHMAETGSSGTPMVTAQVHIDNPDENIYLGIEAKLKILTANEKSTLQVPVEAVNVDQDGEFCYIIENNILVKKYVTTGISSEQYVQILGGLSEGEQIVTSAYMGADVSEGMSVTVLETALAGTVTQTAETVGTQETAETAGTQEMTETAGTQEMTETAGTQQAETQ